MDETHIWVSSIGRALLSYEGHAECADLVT